MTDFDTFWAAYPRRVAKGQARRTFAKLEAEGILPPIAELVAAVERAKANGVFPNPTYSPHASTWLNAERWDDEFDLDMPHTDEFGWERDTAQQGEALNNWRNGLTIAK